MNTAAEQQETRLPPMVPSGGVEVTQGFVTGTGQTLTQQQQNAIQLGIRQFERKKTLGASAIPN